MEYYRILDLEKEPFSNSPDPNFFYRSRQHVSCWHKLEIAIRLRRGLNVIIGDIGTGKTTLCRQLLKELALDTTIDAHLILDPFFSSSREFLQVLSQMFSGVESPPESSAWHLKEGIKSALLRKGAEEKKLVVLVLDEGQKITDECLEILRELLNYETNEFKLLQIVIFAQREFDFILKRIPNFADRINLYHVLEPLDPADTRSMIEFRLEECKAGYRPPQLFTTGAFRAIFWATDGYPRKIINLCHRIMLGMIIQNRSKASFFTAWACAAKEAETRRRFQKALTRRLWWPTGIALTLILMTGGLWAFAPRLDLTSVWKTFARNGAQNSAVISTQAENAQVATPSSVATAPIVAPSENNSTVSPSAVPSGPAQGSGTSAQSVPMTPAVEVKSVVPQTKAASIQPMILGQLTVHQGETLSYLIKEIYGQYRPELVRAVVSANPHIRDGNRIAEGARLSFPAIPAHQPKYGNGEYLVIVDEKQILEEAFAILRTLGYAPYLTLLPSWNPSDGLVIAVIFEKTFPDAQAAKDALLKLPEPFRTGSKLRHQWSKDTLFFAS